MNRRALLACIGSSAVGTAGCAGESTREVTTLLCNLTGRQREGEYRVTEPRSGEVVASASFTLPGSDTASGTTQTDPCREFTSELVSGRTYEFAVDLRSGPSGSEEWTVNGRQSLQVDLHADRVAFERLVDPSP